MTSVGAVSAPPRNNKSRTFLWQIRQLRGVLRLAVVDCQYLQEVSASVWEQGAWGKSTR